MPHSQSTALNPVCQLFTVVPDTRTSGIVAEALATYDRSPLIRRMIEADLDRHALAAKSARMADAEWLRARTAPLPGMSVPATAPAPVQLGVGRPRTATVLVYVGLVLRGFYGSVSDAEAVDRMLESTTLTVLCENLYIRMPDRTTLLRHLNAISNQTREAIIDIQIERVKTEGLDAFNKAVVDSTAVEANTQWPTDSGLILGNLSRVHRLCLHLPEVFDLPRIDVRWCEARLERMHRHDFRIDTASGKGRARKRKKAYRQFYGLAEKLTAHLRNQFETVLEPAVCGLDVRPSVGAAVQEACAIIRTSIADAARILDYSRNRVIHDISTPTSKKILSLSDGDVAFIQKGGRDPVIGYKPQIVRSGAGFIAALSVSPGNTADAPALPPLITEFIRRTQTVPTTVSTDDGYSSSSNRIALETLGVKAISFSGAKGRHLTPEDEWNSEALTEARRERSAVESTIFVLKHDYLFGRMRRRGVEGVRAEMLEKAIAFNFERLIRVRRIRDEEAAKAARAA
jgi:IS5 family transposase